MPSYTTQQIAERVGGALIGPADLEITGVEQLEHAGAGQITFIGNSRFAKAWPDARACAALVDDAIELQPQDGRALIRVGDADLAMAEVLALFAPALPCPPKGIHPTAVVETAGKISPEAAIGVGCYIGKDVTIGEGTVVQANVSILDYSQIGSKCMIWSGVVIRERCQIGDGCILHPNVTIGGDGFGYRPSPNGRKLVKIPQIGDVQIGKDVEIGAGTCIDRGKFASTVIGDGTKIDNLCQIGHNCRIGRRCVIAALCGIGGSVTFGDRVTMGGMAGVTDHVTIGEGATLSANAGVIGDVPAGATWSDFPAHPHRAVVREWVAMRKLPDLVKLLKKK